MDFNCAIIGPPGGGKTSFIKRHLKGSFKRKYKSTSGIDVYEISFNTNKYPVRMTIWELSGHLKFDKVIKAYIEKADCAILIFDLNSSNSAEEIRRYYNIIEDINPKMPKVLCGNKYGKNPTMEIIDCEIPYFNIDVKNKYNLMKPWVSILSQLLNDPDLRLIESENTRNTAEWVSMDTNDSYNKNMTCYDFSKCFNNMKIGVTL